METKTTEKKIELDLEEMEQVAGGGIVAILKKAGEALREIFFD